MQYSHIDLAKSSDEYRGAVIVPALNEGGVVAGVVSSILGVINLPVWVIDDSSSDDTASEAASAGARVIKLKEQLGAWAAVQTGLREAHRLDLDFVVTMDSDGQHLASDVPGLVETFRREQADVVIGSCTERGSSLRKLAWRMMRLTSGLQCEDLTSGFRVLNKPAIRMLASAEASQLDFQDVGVLLILERSGCRIAEHPVTMPSRTNGKSRIFRSWAAVMFYMLQTLLLGAAKRRRTKPIHFDPSIRLGDH
jgi:glycosyltransferase involved in cell wall biosynthesis